jgi:5-methylcytosine-specific restriction endonuclease McrA
MGPDLTLKRCSRCKIHKPVDGFSLSSNKKGGLDDQCKDCKKAYYRANKQRFIDKANAWNAAHIEQKRAANRRWHYNNPERSRANSRKWELSNPEAAKAKGHNYRCKKRNNKGRHTGADIKRLIAFQRGKCGVSARGIRRRFEIDHIIPVSSGGSNYPNNLQLLCIPCNRSKGGKDPLVFMRSRGRLL